MRKLILITVLLLFKIFTSFKGKQVGCIFIDGWRSYSIGGPGTSSQHGEVAYELYESDLENN